MIKFGTCSWKYDSWKGIVYPENVKKKDLNYLHEYAKTFETVEVDQWFWSLFGPDKIKLPEAKTVQEYLDAVPPGFTFTIKIPNSITLTHFYTHGRGKGAPMESNPHAFSIDLFNDFLARLEPLKDYIGVLMFQFEYLNRQKMASQRQFFDIFGRFIEQCPRDIPLAVETRNPNYLNQAYFEFLNHFDLHHVFVQGYYMPPVRATFDKFAGYIKDLAVIRLMGSDRKGIEERAGNKWGQIVDNRDNELPDIVAIIKALEENGVRVFANINNHYEGSAPLTIKKIQEMLKG